MAKIPNEDLSKKVILLGRRFTRPKAAMGILEKLAYRFITSSDRTSDLTVSDRISEIAEIAKRYGVEDVNILGLFYRLFENQLRNTPHNLSESLIGKIKHYESMKGCLPSPNRVEWFLNHFDYSTSSGNYGVKDPATAKRMAQIALEGFVEADSREV
jgi:hypothetical protein